MADEKRDVLEEYNAYKWHSTDAVNITERGWWATPAEDYAQFRDIASRLATELRAARAERDALRAKLDGGVRGWAVISHDTEYGRYGVFGERNPAKGAVCVLIFTDDTDERSER